MKIESISFSDFSIFISSNYLNIDDYKDQEQVVKYVKILVKKLKNRLKLKGFYKLKVFVNSNVGLFVDVIKIDDLEYSNVLDLRVIVFLDSDIYFEIDNKRVNAKSIMGMMTLGINAGEEVIVSADGKDEQDAIASIEKYLSNQE